MCMPIHFILNLNVLMNTLITKDFEIAQPIDVVWKSLANPEEIVGCVPGASITEKIDDRNLSLIHI